MKIQSLYNIAISSVNEGMVTLSVEISSWTEEASNGRPRIYIHPQPLVPAEQLSADKRTDSAGLGSIAQDHV